MIKRFHREEVEASAVVAARKKAFNDVLTGIKEGLQAIKDQEAEIVRLQEEHAKKKQETQKLEKEARKMAAEVQNSADMDAAKLAEHAAGSAKYQEELAGDAVADAKLQS